MTIEGVVIINGCVVGVYAYVCTYVYVIFCFQYKHSVKTFTVDNETEGPRPTDPDGL